MRIKEKDKELLLNGTSQERIDFFNPAKMKQAEFQYRFMLWVRHFTARDFPWSFAPVHSAWAAWYGEMIYSPEQSISKIILSSRDILKTYLAKRFLVYIHLYDISKFSYFITLQSTKLKDEMTAIGALLKDKVLINDYGVVYKTINKEEILFKPFDGEEEGSKIGGSTLLSFPRGDTHADYKPQFLIADDIEARASLRSAADTHANLLKYESDVISSMDNVRRRVLVIGNHLSVFGNHQKLFDSLDDKDRVIVPLYDVATEEPIWSSRFCWDKEEAVASDPQKVSIAALRDEFFKKSGGDTLFRQEFLANPLSAEELFYDIRKIESIYHPTADPSRIDNDGLLEYRIYKEFDPTKQYVAGIDPAEGIGLDDTAFVLIAYDVGKAEIVVTANNNEVKQNEFCGSNIGFMLRYGCRAFIVPEANQGGSYIAHLEQNYPTELIFKRERVGKRGAKVQVDQLGLLRNQLTSRQLLAETLKSALESGSLINLCPVLHAELSSYTSIEHTQNFRRITHETFTSNHHDILSAAQNALFGLRQAVEKTMKVDSPSLSEQGWYKRTPTTLERVTPPEARLRKV